MKSRAGLRSARRQGTIREVAEEAGVVVNAIGEEKLLGARVVWDRWALWQTANYDAFADTRKIQSSTEKTYGCGFLNGTSAQEPGQTAPP